MTLAFIHGAGCLPSIFGAQLEAFPDALTVTLPGHGASGAPSSIGEFADDVAERLAAHERVVLAGSSMGGAIALELALRRLPNVAAVVLLGSSARLRVAPAIFEAIDRDFRGAAEMLAGYFFSEKRRALIDAAVGMMLAVGPEQTRRDFQACDAFDVRERLAQIALPLLALTGEADVMTPVKFAAELANRVPGAEARTIPGAGHLLFVERPAETNEAIRSFVSNLEVSSSK